MCCNSQRLLTTLFALLATSAAIFVRSFVTPSSDEQCSQSQATACFVELFRMMPEVCDGKEPAFRCIHYTFLDDCFKRAGKCHSSVVGAAGVAGLKQAVTNCEHSRRKHSRTSEGTTPLIGSQQRLVPEDFQLLSTLGYLQTHCWTMESRNCSAEHLHSIIDPCEDKMRITSRNTEYDRHRLLRIRLDTARKLMMYNEADKEIECLIVRSGLSDLFELHQTHCTSTQVTQCLCERMRFHELCEIDCSALRARKPNQVGLVWRNLEDAQLVQCNSCRPQALTVFVSLFLFAILNVSL